MGLKPFSMKRKCLVPLNFADTRSSRVDADRYNDGIINLDLCLKAQKYYKHVGCKTKVKAAGLVNADEVKQLAGVDAITIAPDILRLLSKTEESSTDVVNISMFDKKATVDEQTLEVRSFMNSETEYRRAFASSCGGKAAEKTREVC